MSEIIYGLYEQIINGIITENLNKVDQILTFNMTGCIINIWLEKKVQI